MSRVPARLIVGLSLVVALWADGANPAFAKFVKTAAGSTAVAAHSLSAPTLNCNGLGILAANLSWTAPADTGQADVYGSGFLASGYELLRGTASGGPYSVVQSGTGTTFSQSVTAGDYYYVVRTAKHSWRSVLSNERHVHAVLIVLATCS